MYRPEGMRENPYGTRAGNSADLDRMGREIAYEAGADAMLEGLRKAGIPDGNGGYYRLTHWPKPEKAKFETDFIPEEKG